MEKIIKLLKLKPEAAEADVLKAIEDLQARPSTASAPQTARHKLIHHKMSLGLSRETAEEAVANQEAEDKLVEEREDRANKNK